MSRRNLWALLALALFTLTTLTLQVAGVALLTAHLTAAAAALGVVLAARLVRARRSAAGDR